METFRVICGILLVSMCCLCPVFAQTAPHPSESSGDLVQQFESRDIFWKQFEVAKKIVALHDQSVLQKLQAWLGNEDMRRRGNAAFIFAKLGDDRGFHVIEAILDDRSSKRAVFEIDGNGSPNLEGQIRADRYYAAHLFGDLKDPRAVPILIPLLKDEEVKLVVPWSLQQIGDKRAIPALLEAENDSSLEMRAASVLAVEKLEGK